MKLFSHKKAGPPGKNPFRNSTRPPPPREPPSSWEPPLSRDVRINSAQIDRPPVDLPPKEPRKTAAAATLTHPPDISAPGWPDIRDAVRESQQTGYTVQDLPPTDPRKPDLETVAPHARDPGRGDSRTPDLVKIASRSPERRSARPKHNDPRRDDEIEDLQRQIRRVESDYKKMLQAAGDRHAREERQLMDDHKANMHGLSEELRLVRQDAKDQAAEVRHLRQELQTTRSNAERDRRYMEQDHAVKMGSVTRDLQIARDEITHKERRMAQEHSVKVNGLTRDLQNFKYEASQKEQRVAQQHADVVRGLNQEVQKVQSSAEAKERRVAQEHARAINKLNESHAVEISRNEAVLQHSRQHLQLEIEEINQAWLNRDDDIYQAELFTTSGLPHKPDDKIRSQIVELQQMIDDLSRIEWKPSPELWTDRVFQRIGNQQYGQRALRKAIVQDLIWSLLFQRIFCSPFRMFGEEGKLLEREWNEECGKEKSPGDELFAWPSPGIKTERWRYMTTKECREILSKPVPSHIDKRVEVKRGFKMSQDKLLAALEDELERVLELSDHDLEVVEKLAKKAAVTWLEFTMHRCRIVVRPLGAATKSQMDKVSALQKGSLALTVLPTVGRYGNVKGVELDRFTTIKGCEGSTMDIT